MESEREKKLIPEYHLIDKYPKDWTCGCGVRSPYKEDCYFYYNVEDMGANISCCNLHKGLGNCPCENCAKFLSKSNAFKIILNYVNKEEACK